MASIENLKLESRLTFIEFIGHDKHGNKRARYLCSCGNIQECLAYTVNMGHTRSCGCLKKETSSLVGKSNIKHGDYNSTEYYSWTGARNRCRNPNNKDYKSYGGRGIRFCDRWDDYSLFLKDLGRKPSKNHSLERIDVNGPYSPENCKWATNKEQNANRRICMILAADLELLLAKLAQYEKLYGILSL